MKLATYMSETGPRFGRVIDGLIIDLTNAVPRCSSIQDVLARGLLPQLQAAAESRRPEASMNEVELLPVITHPAKILCAGVNYFAHREESGRSSTPAKPTIFIRFGDSQVGSGRQVCIPPAVTQFDYEGELAVIIGRGGRHIAAIDAYHHVAGYACYNDFSARDWQRHSGQWTAGKNFPGTGAFGPYLVTADDVPDVSSLELTTTVNGAVRQFAQISQMIFSIPELIAYISAFTALAPGDVIVTGTPGGVGLFRDPPEFLRPGDVVTVEVTGIGTLTNDVVAADVITSAA